MLVIQWRKRSKPMRCTQVTLQWHQRTQEEATEEATGLLLTLHHQTPVALSSRGVWLPPLHLGPSQMSVAKGLAGAKELGNPLLMLTLLSCPTTQPRRALHTAAFNKKIKTTLKVSRGGCLAQPLGCCLIQLYHLSGIRVQVSRS